MTQSRGQRRTGTPLHLLAIAAAFAVAGCAPSPLYTGHVKHFAPGGVPRDQFGQPAFEAERRQKRGWLGLGRRKPLPPAPVVRSNVPAIIYYQDLRYSDRPVDPAATVQPPAR